MRRTKLVSLALIGGLSTAGIAAVAPPAFAAACSGTITSNITCTAPGTLGSGETVSLPITIYGAGGGGGGNSGEAPGGKGAEISATLSVPAGSSLTFTRGIGGSFFRAAGGGGSSAVTLGSTLLIEAGGGGGSSYAGSASSDTAPFAGGDAAAANTAAGGAGATACGGQGGNSLGTGNGGAGGVISDSCSGTAPSTAVAGNTGATSAAGGAGGNGGSSVGTAHSDGGNGYSPGGDSGSDGGSPNNFGGPGGGGGYGGGGGGSATVSPVQTSSSMGGAGGGGSYANPTYTSGVSYRPSTSGTYGTSGHDGSGGSGALIINGVGPVVQTEVSAPTSVTGTGATVHSMVNGSGVPTNATVQYSTSSTFATIAGSVTSSPTQVTGSSNTSVTTTLTGLAACTTYYYRVTGTQVESPLASAVGSVASFTTSCDTLPLTVHAKSSAKKITRTGSTKVVSSASTSSKGQLQIRVTCSIGRTMPRGDVRYCSYTYNSKGKVVVTTFGYKNLTVKVKIRAVPKKKYKGQVTASSWWSRTWKV